MAKPPIDDDKHTHISGSLDDPYMINARLRHWRITRQLPQETVAEATHVHVNTYRRYERERFPDAKFLIDLFLAYEDIDPIWLLMGPIWVEKRKSSDRYFHSDLKISTVDGEPAAIVEFKESGLNVAKLQNAIEHIETALEHLQATVSTKEKAFLVSLIYRMFDPDEESVRFLVEMVTRTNNDKSE